MSPSRNDCIADHAIGHMPCAGNRCDKAIEATVERLFCEDFRWFMDAPIRAIADIEQPTPGYFYRPQVDADL